MEITRTVTIKIKPDELAKIIKGYLSAEGFESNEKDISFEIESVYEGYGASEHEVKRFSGCNVVCNLKTTRKDNG